MATNAFFRNYNKYGNEAALYEDLVIESIKIYGVDTIYITRSVTAVDNILNEDDLSVFDAAYELEMYVKNVDGFEGEGDFLSKFGLQIRDSITFTVADRSFERHVTRDNLRKVRPNEGDLIYFPLNNKMFKIMHVEHESVFYQLGALHVFDLKCELLEYSGERFDTGRPDVDSYFDYIDTTSIDNLEQLKNTDVIAKNIFFEEEADDILDFQEIDPFSETITNPTDSPSANTADP